MRITKMSLSLIYSDGDVLVEELDVRFRIGRLQDVEYTHMSVTYIGTEGAVHMSHSNATSRLGAFSVKEGEYAAAYASIPQQGEFADVCLITSNVKPY